MPTKGKTQPKSSLKGEIGMKFKTFLSLLTALIGITWFAPAHAIPAWARKYETSCSTCHSTWPNLNSFGRQFKENGYRVARGEDSNAEKVGDFKIKSVFPISAVLVSRPYDKKGSGNSKIRALHEIELVVAGPMADKFSGFFELEMEDEALDVPVAGGGGGTVSIPGFQWTVMPHGAFTYNASPTVNISMAWAPVYWVDPYDTYTDSRRLTRGASSAVSSAFGGLDSTLATPRQQVTISGRPVSKLFYYLGVSGLGGDTEGDDPQSFMGRLAYDFSPGAMVGLLAISGTDTGTGYTRSGIDTQVDVSNFRITGVYLNADDGGTSSYAGYLQGLYTFKNSDGMPTWVPLFRWDTDDGVNAYVASLTYYISPNVKGFLEYWDDATDNRATLQFSASF